MNDIRVPADPRSVFASGEGDAWFERNRERLLAFDPAHDLPLRLLNLYGVRPRRALEIGAANGARLRVLRDELGAEVVGTDLSAAAVADGRERYGLDLRLQAAEELSLEGSFDLVLVNFVLHWLARESLGQVIDNLDALVAEGGLLLVGDFYPDRPAMEPYHHRSDVLLYTHKRDYSKLFVATGNFRRIGFLSGDHDEMDPRAGVPGNDRVGLWLLEKKVRT